MEFWEEFVFQGFFLSSLDSSFSALVYGYCPKMKFGQLLYAFVFSSKERGRVEGWGRGHWARLATVYMRRFSGIAKQSFCATWSSSVSVISVEIVHLFHSFYNSLWTCLLSHFVGLCIDCDVEHHIFNHDTEWRSCWSQKQYCFTGKKPL